MSILSDKPCHAPFKYRCLINKVSCDIRPHTYSLRNKGMEQCKVDVFNFVSNLNQTPIFEWCMISHVSKNGNPNRHVLKGNWTTCSKFC